MRDPRPKRPAWLLSLVLAAVLGMAGCAGTTDQGSTPAETATEQTAESTEATSATEEGAEGQVHTAELKGKPWVTSILQYNLPDEAPPATDDLYTHFGYEWLKAHQDAPATNMIAAGAEVPAAMAAIIQDESRTDHDLEQMRLFYNQAADFDTLKETGMAEVQPYLDRIDAVTSLDELNELIVADDFPFSPFVVSNVGTSDLRENYIASVAANLLFADPYLAGGAYYQDGATPEESASIAVGLQQQGQYLIVDLMAQGMSQEDASADYKELTAFEKTYGKYCDYASKFNGAGYGARAESDKASLLTADELYALSPNFPLKATLEKVGKGTSELYSTSVEWLRAFNDAWVEENLDQLKKIARYKVLQETRPYRDPTGFDEIWVSIGQPSTDEATFAYNACSSLDTFAQVMAKSYVSEVLGDEAKTRIEGMAGDLLDVYRELISKSAWVGDESRAALLEKIDHMTLNILEPDGGYFDYADLELVPTEEGGTLFSNYLRLKQYRLDCESALIGTPAHATSTWNALSPTITNATYDPSSNSINVYPGYVSSLAYNKDMSDADMLSAIGFALAHEISHAFDYTGSQYDAYGRPEPVFTGADVDAFEQKTASLADYYSTIEIAPGTFVNGTNVVGEAAADLSGMQATLALGAKTEGFDYERFCSQFATYWGKVANEATFPVLLADTHPLDNLRMNVCSQMFDDMYDTLGVKEGDAMWLAPEKRIVIWGENA